MEFIPFKVDPGKHIGFTPTNEIFNNFTTWYQTDKKQTNVFFLEPKNISGFKYQFLGTWKN